jgi:hypothetical protein
VSDAIRRRGALSGVAAVVTVLALAGCAGLALPPVGTVSTTRSTRNESPLAARLRLAQTTHELPSPAPPQYAPGAASPVQAIRRFAEQYVNWTAADVARRMTALARASVGQARSEMTLTAAQVHADPTLGEAGIANHGTVEAVAPLAAWPYGYIVVTREWTTATHTTAYQGLAPAWHVILVTVSRVTGTPHGTRGRAARSRWAVSVWQPEN